MPERRLDRDGLTRVDGLKDLAIEGHAGKRGENHHHPDVHDVPSPATPIPAHEVVEGHGVTLTLDARPCFGALHELDDDDRHHEGRQTERQQSHAVVHTSKEQRPDDGRTHHDRHTKVLHEVAARGPSPGDDRSDPHQGEQSQPDGQVDPVEKRRAYRDGRSRQTLADEREKGAP